MILGGECCMFAAHTYVSRRATLASSLKSGLLVLLGNDESPMNYTDNTYHFRQDSTFLYYVGLSHAGLSAVVDADAGETTVFGNDLTIDDIVWTGPPSWPQPRA
jgi:Xaa-Pro aminopeptidase